MRITGYRTLTEKERDYLTIHRLLHKHQIIPTSEVKEFLKGGLATDLVYSSVSVEFCVVDDNLPNCTIVLDQLPENTTELFIEI